MRKSRISKEKQANLLAHFVLLARQLKLHQIAEELERLSQWCYKRS